MNVFDILQLLGGIILSVGYIPQIVKLIKTKSAEDFELKTFLSIEFGVLLMEIYAIDLVVNGSGTAFLITNTMALTIQGIFIALIIYYKKKKKKG